jgi:ABC-type Fe3+-hydroxamate transport system substrate-binding protein
LQNNQKRQLFIAIVISNPFALPSRPMTLRIPSPCIKVCTLHPTEDHCLGCLRMGDEITHWSAMGDEGRLKVLDRLAALDPPQRIISLVPSQTELLCTLGLSERLIGVTRYCVHPSELQQTKTIIGGTKKLNFERIAELKPDLIIANKEENRREDIARLRDDYRVWMSDVNHLEDACLMIKIIGALTHTLDKAETLAHEITQNFAALPKKNLRRAAYLIWRKPWMAAARDTFIDSLLPYAGFENVFSDQSRYPVVDETALQHADPEIILLSSEPYPFREKHLQEIKDILPNAKIHFVNGEYFSWYGSRLRGTPQYFQSLLM